MSRLGRQEAPVLVTGGAGFIGSNVASRLLEAGERVILFDNLARPQVQNNVGWLRARFGRQLQVTIGDVRDPVAVDAVVSEADHVYHFAAQVAVTTSLVDPGEDFAVNAQGTLNVLEAVRRSPRRPSLLFTSTNKVYGALDDVPLRATGGRYEPQERALRATGIPEGRRLDFHSPYGCSKGSADQYVCDYARSFGVRAVVFRMSCIYGPRQFGTEDQGWVAHLLIRALRGEPITIYGDGLQVRDVLYVRDLVDAMEKARANVDRLSGRAFNLGGGPGNTLSLLDLLDRIAGLTGRRPEVVFSGWRTGDQRYYVSDTRAFGHETGWSPRVGVNEGIASLQRWLVENAGRLSVSREPPIAEAT
jgi:CDP-paratose 2-epimerase